MITQLNITQMEKNKTRTEQILKVLEIIAWIAFIGFLIKGGTILISFVVSLVNPEAAMNLYQGLNLSELKQFNLWYYTYHVSFMVSLVAMKAYVWWLVIHILSKMNLEQPFTMNFVQKLERISYQLVSIWFVAVLANGYSKWLTKFTETNYLEEASSEFLFMAGLIFIISQIFKRGVEIQAENELTV